MKVRVDMQKKLLIIELPLISPPKPSSTGKTLMVASTLGNKESECVINDQNVIVGVNAYIYPTPKGTKSGSKEDQD